MVYPRLLPHLDEDYQERIGWKIKDKAAAARRFDRQGAQQYKLRIRAAVPGYDALHEMTRALLEQGHGRSAA